MKDSLAKWIFHHLSAGPKYGWETVIPGAECELYFGEIDDGKPMHYASTYNNDGFELWIAYSHGGWQFHCRAEHARRLAGFILWDWWVVSTWFGLKRRLWYWSNRQMLEQYKRHNAQPSR